MTTIGTESGTEEATPFLLQPPMSGAGNVGISASFNEKGSQVMRSSKLFLISILFVFGISILLTSSAVAMIIENTTTSTLLFSDDFEGLGSAVSHAEHPDSSGDYDPDNGSNPGSWWGLEEAGSEPMQVTDHTGGVDPGAYQGSNYLRLVRELGASNTRAKLRHGNLNPTDNGGEHLRLETMLYSAIASGTQEEYLYWLGNANAYRIGIVLDPVDGVVRNWGPSGYQDVAGLVPTAGQWQRYTIDYTIGASTYTLGIDGTTVSGIPVRAIGDLERFSIEPDQQRVGGVTYPLYVDAVVPQPCSLAMLAAGLMGLLAYAWRKRR